MGDLLLRLLVQKQHELEMEAAEEEGQYGLVAPPGRHDAIHLDCRHPLLEGKVEDVEVRPTLHLVPGRLRLALLLAVGLSPNFERQVERDDVVDDAFRDVAVKRPLAEGDLVGMRRPYVVEVLAFLHERLNELDDPIEVLGRAVDAPPRVRAPLRGLLVRDPGVVEAARVAAAP